MKTSDAINELSSALAKAQGEIEAAKKDGTNPHFRSKYADLASVWAAIRGPLSKNGLSVVQAPSTVTSESTVSIAVTTRICHESGQWIEDSLTIACPRPDNPQVIGSAITYARRYALSAMTGVAPDDDDDAEGAAAPARKGKPKEPKKPEPVDDDYVTKFAKCCTAAKDVKEIDDHGKMMKKCFDAGEINEATYQKCRDLAKARRVVLQTEAVTA